MIAPDLFELVEVAADPTDATVRAYMIDGLAPSEIDKLCRWVPGTAHDIAVSYWRRDKLKNERERTK